MYLFLDIGVTALQELESGCGTASLAVTVAVTLPLRPLRHLADTLPQPQRYRWRMTRPNLVRQRFLAELESWLTPSLLYHCFTGESDPYRLAHVERLQPALQEPLLNKAESQWPERLERIAAERRAQKQQDKAAVRAFVVGSNTEPQRYD
ncbi:MAG: hypothetical protein RLZZ515_1003 [Cyanobacteriota bacterium]|jgi:hypothetical protein